MLSLKEGVFMAKTDNPLKVIVDRHAEDYVSWLLGKDCQLIAKHPTELSETERRADMVYEIQNQQGQSFIQHIEFQQYRPSDEPMPFRMTEYAVRLWKKHHLPVCGTVIYLLTEADVNDRGYFEMVCPLDQSQILRCHYKVVRLWKIDGRHLLEGDYLGLYPLVPLTRLENPKETLQQVVQRIRSIPQAQTKADLLFGVWLISGLKEGIRSWLEGLIRREEMIESPLYQEIIQEGKLIGLEEGELIGLEKGLEKGRQEGELIGLEKGRQEGKLKACRTTILDALSARFELSYRKREELREYLDTISDVEQLQELHSKAVTTESLDDFEDYIKIKLPGE